MTLIQKFGNGDPAKACVEYSRYLGWKGGVGFDEPLTGNKRFAFITQLVADEFGVLVAELLGLSRFAKIAEPRHVAIALCYGPEPKKRNRFGNRVSAEDVGKFFRRSDSDVSRSIRKVKDLRETDKSFDEKICAIEAKLNL